MAILSALIPIFIIILAGYLSRRLNVLSHTLTTDLTKLTFYLIVPITLFIDIGQLPISTLLTWHYMGAYFLTSLILCAFSGFLFFLWFHRRSSELIINMMASIQVNTAYLALPIFLLLFNTISPVASIILVQVVFNVMFLLSFEIISRSQSADLDWYLPIKIIFKNPLILGILGGLLLSLSHTQLTATLLNTGNLVRQAAPFVALFALGTSLAETPAHSSHINPLELSVLIVLKSIMHPLLAYIIGLLIFHLSHTELLYLTLMAAMPAAKNVFIFAYRYNAGKNRASMIVLITTLITILTLQVILAIAS